MKNLFNQDIKKDFAFTLSEVLITLGIIGVISAITLPVLVTNYQKHQTIVKLKKVYSMLNHTFKLSQVENDEFDGWQSKNEMGATQYFEKYWHPYMNGVTICKTYQECGYSENHPWQTMRGERKNSVGVVDNATDNRISFYMLDGTFISLSGNIYVDLNGAKRPNIYGKDFFVFQYDSSGVIPSAYNNDEAFIKARCSKSSNYDSALCATRIIKYDNWQIASDYPW